MPTRRRFLTGSAALAGMPLPVSLLAAIDRAAALPAHHKTGTLQDVEHVVILMQENRSFDHYFGTLGGVRGFNDRITVPERRGRTVWEQADGKGGIVSPFLLDSERTAAQHIHSLPHSWDDAHAAWNHGWLDNWVPAKGPMTMAAFSRRDLPFHYALADAFTLCDAYHCSIPSATNPNRAFLLSGTVDSAGAHGGPMFRQPLEDETFHLRSGQPFSWTTYPERLQAAAIDWRIYQGTDPDGPFRADPQDAIPARRGSRLAATDSAVSSFNPLRFFAAYDEADAASPLYERAMQRRPPSVFAADAKAGRLPAVSWICPPQCASEHPKWTPAEGAVFIASVLDALTANPETWSRTVLFIPYDENDGFFDHVPPPAPPGSAAEGLSNVDIAGEIRAEDGQPYGLGPRVPMLVVSPWSRGGAVCSQVFDHTSVIRFLEARFGVQEPNISPWRRAVCGDLTAAFDFAGPDPAPPRLPDTRGFIAAAEAQATLPKAGVPDVQVFPGQEAQQRPYRPLPYDTEATLEVAGPASVRLSFRNEGRQGAVLHVFDQRSEAAPRRYTVAAGTLLSDAWACGDDGAHDLYILGPAGFLRHFRGLRNDLDIRLEKRPGRLHVVMANRGARAQVLTLVDLAYGAAPKDLEVEPGRMVTLDWSIADSDDWYDLEVSSRATPEFRQRFAGHVEDAPIGRTDPALGRPPRVSAR